MSILTDDMDIRDTNFWMEYGGNGDYYLNLMETIKDGKPNRLSFRVAISGGNLHRQQEIRLTIAKLYRLMEEEGLNNHPKDISS